MIFGQIRTGSSNPQSKDGQRVKYLSQSLTKVQGRASNQTQKFFFSNSKIKFLRGGPFPPPSH